MPKYPFAPLEEQFAMEPTSGNFFKGWFQAISDEKAADNSIRRIAARRRVLHEATQLNRDAVTHLESQVQLQAATHYVQKLSQDPELAASEFQRIRGAAAMKQVGGTSAGQYRIEGNSGTGPSKEDIAAAKAKFARLKAAIAPGDDD